MNPDDPWPDGWDLPEPSEEEGRILDLFCLAAETGTAGLVFLPPASEDSR